MIVYRHTDPRFPFLWESAGQPGSRWNVAGEGPVNTFADTPEGAWAELLRHEEIADPADVLEVRRSNAAARQLYERFGFVVAGTRSNYYTNPIEDALVLWREERRQRP